ncbi:heparinase II/III family protein [Chitinolyticbacter meiyuanensis]|uniref:heparinase II/III family protein n=1 Tax=Chitinolyticbacter meiyuanensis TaxID=682798 RepID=UPI0011E5AD5C|nr:alginate lyase family protein [Chitinolyticbacter meiyuanensis]
MQGLTWYYNRLRCMSLGEVAHRVLEHGRKSAEKRGLALAPRPELTAQSGPRWFGVPSQLEASTRELIISRADGLLAGDWLVFGVPKPLGMPPNWLQDPLTGTIAPLRYGMGLSLTDRAVVGDIKYLWEPARHLEWVTLAQAWALTQDTRYLDALGVCLSSWLEQAPYPMGPHWASSLEVAIRLINWAMVWQLIGQAESPLWQGAAGAALLRDWLLHIHQSQHFIRHHLSRHSSANNHLIGELAGLFIGCCTWHDGDEVASWRAYAQTELADEALKQNGGDGINREQAISYQQFVFEFLFWAGSAGAAHGQGFAPAYWERLLRMAEWVATLRDVAGNVPNIGDADDGYVTRLGAEAVHDPYAQMLQVAGGVFGIPAWQTAGEPSPAAPWWLAQPVALPARPEPLAVAPRWFAEGGYAVIGEHWGSEHEVKIVLDAGPLGYLGIAAHGHADALSLQLSVGGVPVLVDPGTYSYHAPGPWREHFRGTAAHNTVSIDGQSQSLSGGRFMWIHHAAARCEQFSTNDRETVWAGRHDGYRRLPSKASHWRRVVFDHQKKQLIVTDRIDVTAPCRVTLHWQHAADVEAVLSSQGWDIKAAGRVIPVWLRQGKGQWQVVTGEESPPAGWVSARYGDKQPAPQVNLTQDITTSTTWETVFDLSGWLGH